MAGYLWLPLSYLCGSVPFAWLLGRLAGVDIRKGGSGNIGATNLYRQCGWRYGVPALLLDAAKGVLPVLCFAPLLAASGAPGLPGAGEPAALAVWTPILCGLAAILGHTFPLWFRFRGGKGVATSAGVLGAIFPIPLAIALGVFALVLGITRYVSLGSMLAALALALSATFFADEPAGVDLPRVVFAWVVAALVIVLHRGNLVRLREGRENRFAFRKK